MVWQYVRLALAASALTALVAFSSNADEPKAAPKDAPKEAVKDPVPTPMPAAPAPVVVHPAPAPVASAPASSESKKEEPQS